MRRRLRRVHIREKSAPAPAPAHARARASAPSGRRSAPCVVWQVDDGSGDVQRYNEKILHETIRVSVCEVLEEGLEPRALAAAAFLVREEGEARAASSHGR